MTCPIRQCTYHLQKARFARNSALQIVFTQETTAVIILCTPQNINYTEYPEWCDYSVYEASNFTSIRHFIRDNSVPFPQNYRYWYEKTC